MTSTDQKTDETDPNRRILGAILDDDGITVVRVLGRGSFSNSLALRNFAEHALKIGKAMRLVVDLGQCDAMDSTFMGVLAGICIRQSREGLPKTIVLNVSEHCQRLLKNLGLTHLLEIRQHDESLAKADDQLAPAEADPSSRLDQICLTLQAHRNLVQVDSENQVRFQAVIDYLEKSLSEEKNAGNNGGSASGC